MRAMSINRFGRASRMAMSGTRVWPPAMTRASSPAASIAQAWSRSAALTYSNDAGFIERRALAPDKRGQRGLRSAHGNCHYHGGERASRGRLGPLSALVRVVRRASTVLRRRIKKPARTCMTADLAGLAGYG